MGSIASKCAEDDERQAWEARKRKEEERIKPMSKATENSKQMIRLSLPLIEIDSNSIFDIENYKEDGLFLVKSSDGAYSILDINRKNKVVLGEILPPNIANLIVEYQFDRSLKDIFEKRFEEMAEDMNGTLHWFEQRLIESTKKMEDALQYRSGEIIEKLEELVEKIKQAPSEDVPKLLQGYISETVLVEIIRTIK